MKQEERNHPISSSLSTGWRLNTARVRTSGSNSRRNPQGRQRPRRFRRPRRRPLHRRRRRRPRRSQPPTPPTCSCTRATKLPNCKKPRSVHPFLSLFSFVLFRGLSFFNLWLPFQFWNVHQQRFRALFGPFASSSHSPYSFVRCP